MRTDNFLMKKYDPYATVDEVEDLAPPLSMEEATKYAKDLINNLPDDLMDIDLGTGL